MFKRVFVRTIITASQLQCNKEHIVRYLIDKGVPEMLQKNINKDYLSNDIKLIFFDNKDISIVGQKNYYFVSSLLRLIINTLITHKCKLISKRVYKENDISEEANEKELLIDWISENSEISGRFKFKFDDSYKKIKVHSIEAIKLKKTNEVGKKNPALTL